jgi:UDP-2,4-diacetamido-2,4,6-trideoxy-beta-L-altropyranose hydrolase
MVFDGEKILNVVFRVDASTNIGGGHVYRCINLAKELKSLGANVHFVCRDFPGHLIELLNSYEISNYLLPLHNDRSDIDDYSTWLGVPLEEDVEQVKDYLSNKPKPDWLVIDHYGIDSTWESLMRPWVGSIMCIDDLANRHHNCDILLDQNYYKFSANRYEKLLPKNTFQFLGPKFSLLHKDFSKLRDRGRVHTGAVKKLLVFFGSSDLGNVTNKVLNALDDPLFSCLKIVVVVGNANPHSVEISNKCKKLSASLHIQSSEMPELIFSSDLALGATGISTWERSCLGLPAIVVNIADNQKDIAQEANDLGILKLLGDYRYVDTEDWKDAIIWCLNNPDQLALQSKVGLSETRVDGARVVAEKMFENYNNLHR